MTETAEEPIFGSPIFGAVRNADIPDEEDEGDDYIFDDIFDDEDEGDYSSDDENEVDYSNVTLAESARAGGGFLPG